MTQIAPQQIFVFRSFNSAIGVIEKFQIWTLSHRITTNPLI